MRKLFRENVALFLVALISMMGLFALSYLTALNFCYEMEEQYDESANEEIIHELETSISYGKKLEKYYGLPDVLQRAKSLLREGTILLILNQNGRAVATSNGESVVTVDRTKFGELRQDILNPDGTVAGTFLTFYPLESIKRELRWDVLKSVLGSLLIFHLILLACLQAQQKLGWTSRKFIRIIVGGVLIQGLFLGMLYVPRFYATTERNVQAVSLYLKNVLDNMEERGILVKDIRDLEEVLQEKMDAYEWIDEIYLTDMGTVGVTERRSVIPLAENNRDLVVVFHISDSYIRQQVVQMFLTFLATIFIAVVFMTESLPISDLIAFRRSKQFNTRCAPQFQRISHTIRYMSFLSNTFGYLCLSFSALQIKAWNQGCLGLSPAIAAALSISLCTLAEAGGMLLMPALPVPPRFLSLGTSILLTLSNLACFFTHSTGIILLMRFFAGAASAGHKRVSNFIVSHGYSTEEERSANLSGNNAGVIGGILCGMGLGSTIASVFGYGATFFAAGIGNILYLSFTFIFIPWKLFEENVPSKKTATKISGMLKLLASRSIWRSIFLFVVPQYFLLMVIIVLIPGRIQSMGMPTVVLTYSNLLNGIFGLYLGGYVGLFLHRHLGTMRSMALMFALGAVSIGLLGLPFFPVLTVLFTASLTGIVDGVGSPLSAELFLGSPALSNMEESSSLMVYSILGSVVMSVSPVVLEFCESSTLWSVVVCLGLLRICFLLAKLRVGGDKGTVKHMVNATN